MNNIAVAKLNRKKLVTDQPCKTCKYSHKEDINEPRICRRYPPNIMQIPIQKQGTIGDPSQMGWMERCAYPKIQDDSTCGEWKPRIDKVN